MNLRPSLNAIVESVVVIGVAGVVTVLWCKGAWAKWGPRRSKA